RIVEKLPVEAVRRNIKDCFLAAAGISGGHLHILSTEVHVREQRDDIDVLLGNVSAPYLVVRRLRRYREIEGSCQRRNNLLLQFRLSEIKTDARAIHLRFSIGMIVK